MASVQVRTGRQKRFLVSGQDDAGNPAPLDATNPLRLTVLEGGTVARQSARDPFEIVVASSVVGSVDRFRIEADGDAGSGESLVPLDVDSTTIAANATVIGLAETSDEAAGTPD